MAVIRTPDGPRRASLLSQGDDQQQTASSDLPLVLVNTTNGATTAGMSYTVTIAWPPDELLCPITRELMLEPMVAADGYTYERSALCAWFDGGHDTSPMTNARLDHLHMIPNRALKMLIGSLSRNVKTE